MYLATSSSGSWVNAVNGNTGGSSNTTPILESLSAVPGCESEPERRPGRWGVDTLTHTAWAILNHDAEFAVVPEPGTIALLLAGVVFLLPMLCRRLRKNA